MIDARDRGQFSGAIARGHGRRGHIPGAVSIPRDEVIDPATGTFRSNEELTHLFSNVGVQPEQHIVAYCNGGVAATTILFSLALLGYDNLTNYDGSWNEVGQSSRFADRSVTKDRPAVRSRSLTGNCVEQSM